MPYALFWIPFVAHATLNTSQFTQKQYIHNLAGSFCTVYLCCFCLDNMTLHESPCTEQNRPPVSTQNPLEQTRINTATHWLDWQTDARTDGRTDSLTDAQHLQTQHGPRRGRGGGGCECFTPQKNSKKLTNWKKENKKQSRDTTTTKIKLWGRRRGCTSRGSFFCERDRKINKER